MGPGVAAGGIQARNVVTPTVRLNWRIKLSKHLEPDNRACNLATGQLLFTPCPSWRERVKPPGPTSLMVTRISRGIAAPRCLTLGLAREAPSSWQSQRHPAATGVDHAETGPGTGNQPTCSAAPVGNLSALGAGQAGSSGCRPAAERLNPHSSRHAGSGSKIRIPSSVLLQQFFLKWSSRITAPGSSGWLG